MLRYHEKWQSLSVSSNKCLSQDIKFKVFKYFLSAQLEPEWPGHQSVSNLHSGSMHVVLQGVLEWKVYLNRNTHTSCTEHSFLILLLGAVLEMSRRRTLMKIRCFDCGISETSCMCVDCFDREQHKGHNYRMYQARS